MENNDREKKRKRRNRSYYHRQAKAIYDLQMREAVIRWTAQHVSDDEIARRLGQTVSTIKRYRKAAIDGAIQRARALPPLDPDNLLDVPPNPHPPGTLPYTPPFTVSPRVRYAALSRKDFFRAREFPVTNPDFGVGVDPGSPLGFSSSRGLVLSAPDPESSSDHAGESGEVLDPPEIIQLRRDCLHLRKAAVPFDQMAHLLGISTEEARRRTREALQEIQESEALHADDQRTLMIEQIDQMIQAIHAPATGRDLGGKSVPVIYDAIDRMLKLMKQKADLLGISQPPAIDIRIKLQALADEGGYDLVEIEEIARDVLRSHQPKLPEYR